MNKKKNLLIFLIICTFVIGCIGCANKKNVSEDVNESISENSSDAVLDSERGQSLQSIEDELDPNLTEQERESIAFEMARNNIGYAQYRVKDGWIYGAAPNLEQSRLYFGKRRLEENDWKALNSCYALDLDFEKEYIYVILDEGEKEPVYKMTLGGSNIKKIVDGRTSDLQIKNEKLYFCYYENDVPYFTCCELDGSNMERILEKEVYYPYTPDGNLFLYQDDKNNETIHKYNATTKEDVRISQAYAYVPIYDGKKTLYYVRNDKSVNQEDFNGDLVKRNIDTGEEQVLYSGVYTGDLCFADNYLYFANMNDERRMYAIDTNGENIKLISDEPYSTGIQCIGEQLVYTTLGVDNGREYIDNIYYCNLNGSNRFSFLQ